MKNEIMRLAEAMAVAMAGEKDAVALTEARAALGAAAEKLTAERDALKSELARPESTAVSMMRAENAELTAQLETLQYEVDSIPAIKAERDQLQRDFTYIKQRRDALLVVLDKLARLGNGNHYGNSEGNAIAIAALNGANNA